MATAELEEELWGLQAGEERRGSDASHVVECCLDTVAEQLHTLAGRWVHQRHVCAMRAFRRVLCLILLGFGVQLVNAEDQEISPHRAAEKDLFPALRVESGGRWKKMEPCELCEWRLEERGFPKEKEKKNCQAFKETARGATMVPWKKKQPG